MRISGKKCRFFVCGGGNKPRRGAGQKTYCRIDAYLIPLVQSQDQPSFLCQKSRIYIGLSPNVCPLQTALLVELWIRHLRLRLSSRRMNGGRAVFRSRVSRVILSIELPDLVAPKYAGRFAHHPCRQRTWRSPQAWARILLRCPSKCLSTG